MQMGRQKGREHNHVIKTLTDPSQLKKWRTNTLLIQQQHKPKILRQKMDRNLPSKKVVRETPSALLNGREEITPNALPIRTLRSILIVQKRIRAG